MKYLLPLLLILSACYYGKGQTTQNVGYGAGTLSSLDSVSSYNFCMGWLACDFLIKGSYNIVIKAGGIAQTTDTSFVFLVDYDISYLKDRGDMTAVLKGAEKQMKQQPSLRTNVTYRKALYLRLAMLMRSDYGLIADTLHFSIPVPPGTVGWVKWCDTCQTVFFGFYHDGRISDYIGGFGRSKAAALPMVIAPCDLDDKTKWIQPL